MTLTPAEPPPSAPNNSLDGNDAAQLTENIVKLDRRTFVKITGLVGSGLMLGTSLSCQSRSTAAKTVAGQQVFSPGAWLQITAQRILVYASNPEIGQGVKTALPMILVEELDANWEDVVIEQSAVDKTLFGRQGAVGSSSISNLWDPLRKVGAVARVMLLQAAAARWGVATTACKTENGCVIHIASERRLDYRALAEEAATLPMPNPKKVSLKKTEAYRLLGTRVSGVDNRALVTGMPLFSSDQQLPGMTYAVYHKCPARGGKVAHANLQTIRSLPGVVDAFVMEGNGNATELMPGIAIVAKNTWAAFSAKEALQVEWDETHAAKDSWSETSRQAFELAPQKGQKTVASAGDIETAFKSAAHVIDGRYAYHVVAHAPMEPQNCTAWFQDGTVELWSSTQNPQGAAYNVSRALDIAPARVSIERIANKLGFKPPRVNVHQLRAGGGFGRRLYSDPECEAAAISRHVGGPVKLQWTREDDMSQDFYRAGGFHSLSAALDREGSLTAWTDHTISLSENGKTPVTGGKISENIFPIRHADNYRLEQTLLPWSTPCGAWRAPNSNVLAFVMQSFIDELSHTAGHDHRTFLLDLLAKPLAHGNDSDSALDAQRASAVIRLATEKAGWGKKMPPDRGQGLAFYFSHSGYVAEVAEVSVTAQKKIRVHSVTVAADAGRIINMSGAQNQCEGSVIDGLSTLLGLSVTHENGRIRQTNFQHYPLLRMPHAPEVAVHFVNSEKPPTGLGEPALPPLAPAVCNAIFAASGHRIRTMPISEEGFST
jgi:isoquinoline 1-oxidoreductase beta subunit